MSSNLKFSIHYTLTFPLCTFVGSASVHQLEFVATK